MQVKRIKYSVILASFLPTLGIVFCLSYVFITDSEGVKVRELLQYIMKICSNKRFKLEILYRSISL